MGSIFQNKKVIIAGGTSGIGLATARLLAANNHSVTVTGRNPEKLKAVSQAPESAASQKSAFAADQAPGKSTGPTPVINAVALDSTDRPALDIFFKQHGPVDHLVVALSGGKGAGSFADLSLEELREGFEKKFWPQLHTAQAALPYMNTDGSITFITAISATAKIPGVSGLAAINGSLEVMVPILARELKPLRINAVSPGLIDTPWWDFMPETAKQEALAYYLPHIPVGRMGRPEEVANAILFLIGNEYMTGKIVACDGGLA